MKDHIMLDFFPAVFILVKNVYVARFEWKGVEYRKDGTIQLKESFMSHDTELE
jgi:hypothetical protein